MDHYVHVGDNVIYKGDGIRWQVRTLGELYGPALTTEQAEAINGTADLSLTYPDHRSGSGRQATATLGPGRLCVRKPVHEGDNSVIFMYTGDVHSPHAT